MYVTSWQRAMKLFVDAMKERPALWIAWYAVGPD